MTTPALTLTEEVEDVVQTSFHTAKYGTEWTREDHARLAGLLRRVGQEDGGAWARAVGFALYLVTRRVDDAPAGIVVVGLAASPADVAPLAPRAEWAAQAAGAAPLLAVAASPDGALGLWKLTLTGEEDLDQWALVG